MTIGNSIAIIWIFAENTITKNLKREVFLFLLKNSRINICTMLIPSAPHYWFQGFFNSRSAFSHAKVRDVHCNICPLIGTSEVGYVFLDFLQVQGHFACSHGFLNRVRVIFVGGIICVRQCSFPFVQMSIQKYWPVFLHVQ